jgi:hypothetical protein
MLTNKLLTDQQCVTCKVVSSLLFAGAGFFHGIRVNQLWRFYPLREKLFNVFALTFLFGVSLANANAAYWTYQGQSLRLLEPARPSLYDRLTGNVQLSNAEK